MTTKIAHQQDDDFYSTKSVLRSNS